MTVKSVEKHGLMIGYFDGRDQLVPFVGYYIEGTAPYVPEDDAMGWVCFEWQDATADLAWHLFSILGFTSDQVIDLLKEF